MATHEWLWGMCLVFGLSQPAFAQPAEAPPPPAKKAPKKDRGKKKVVDLSAEVAAINGADLEAAARAADTLGASAEPAAHDALLDALALGLPPAVTGNAFVALVKHPAPADVAALRRYAAHHSPSVRSAAIGALAMYPDPNARLAVIAGLHDPVASVRASAAAAAGKGRVRDAVDSMIKLLAKGEEASARALAAMADTELARKLADQLGKVPEASLALTLGLILKRPDFGPDPERVEIVRAIAKIADPAAVAALTDYLDATPKNPPRPSRQEAQGVVEARAGSPDKKGGKPPAGKPPAGKQ
jgi:HEAT repeat protein